ncbi:MAG TPA: efflux RND transporter periplasmic adaptor subunit [Candidatus Eisenbacteria bacterium]|nr:efflux RND transporter periplasmic adaptor subunit [Candidatus Eisenbacteria bacterium]
MIRKYMLPVLAVVGVAFAVATVVRGNQPKPVAEPVAQPARAPFESFVAGSGIIEASTENIAVGTPVSGIVMEIYVKWGDHVRAGDPLFKIDDRDLQANLLVAEANVKEAEANLAQAKHQLGRAESVPDKRAISVEELQNRRDAVGVDGAALEAAKAQVEQTQIEIARRTIRALVPGEILQIKTRLGEFAQGGVLATPLMLLGDDTRLHVRVDVDENDAWRFRPGAAAVAFVRGNPDLKTTLRFERFEPYVIPKQSLTGDTTERVDTRVLEVIYSFDEGALPVYVGQQMDVFIEAPPLEAVRAKQLAGNAS